MQHWTPWGSCLSESHLLRPVFGALDPPPIGSAMSWECRKLCGHLCHLMKHPEGKSKLFNQEAKELQSEFEISILQIQPLPTSNPGFHWRVALPRWKICPVQLPSSCSAAVSHKATGREGAGPWKLLFEGDVTKIFDSCGLQAIIRLSWLNPGILLLIATPNFSSYFRLRPKMGLVKRIEQVPREDPHRNDHCLELAGCTGWFGFIQPISQTRSTCCVLLDLHHIFRNSKQIFGEATGEMPMTERQKSGLLQQLCPIRVGGLNLPSSQG